MTRDEIVRAAWHGWFAKKYPDTPEYAGPPKNASELINHALALALPPGTVAVEVERLWALREFLANQDGGEWWAAKNDDIRKWLAAKIAEGEGPDHDEG